MAGMLHDIQWLKEAFSDIITVNSELNKVTVFVITFPKNEVI
jgi:hypothetical protein